MVGQDRKIQAEHSRAQHSGWSGGQGLTIDHCTAACVCAELIQAHKNC